MNLHHNNQGQPDALHAWMGKTSDKLVAHAKTHCWYCSKPLNGYRRFCSKECEEAIYEDTSTAETRRLIFGCHC